MWLPVLLLFLLPPPARPATLHTALATARSAFSSACSGPAPHPVCGSATAAHGAASPSSPAPAAAWALADALTAMHRFSEAAALRELALRVGALPAAPSAWAALAHDLRHARQYPEALAAVREAQRAAGGGGGGGGGGGSDGAPPPPPSPLLLPTLLEFEAELLSCLGDARALDALRVFARAARARRGADAAGEGAGTPPPPPPPAVALQELALLDRALRAPPSVVALPSEVARGLAARRAAVVARMVGGGSGGGGPWRSEAQLPAHFDPSLRAAPWWEGGDARGARAALAAAAPALRAEFAALRDAARLEPETECIAEPRWLGAAAPPAGGVEFGGWRVFTAQGPWHEERDAHHCAAALSPAACALARELTALGAPVLRVGYSALAPGAQLRPHYGPTNTVLKYHLGLHVPVDAAGVGCAAITVGGETRRWERDGVLCFDDSFLHNVSYPEGCGGGEERVVFQVVFQHPDGKGGKGEL
jgi:hypothetical protein